MTRTPINRLLETIETSETLSKILTTHEGIIGDLVQRVAELERRLNEADQRRRRERPG